MQAGFWNRPGAPEDDSPQTPQILRIDPYYVAWSDDALLARVLELRPLLLSGPASSGKSKRASQLLAGMQIPVIRVDCTPTTGRADLYGAVEIAPTGETYFRFGALPAALVLSQTIRVALWLEELTALGPEEQKLLLGAFDDRCSIAYPRLHRVIQGNPANLRIIATANPPSYGGTSPLNAELEGRMLHRHMSWPESQVEISIILAALRAKRARASSEDHALTALTTTAAETPLVRQLVALAAKTRAVEGIAIPLTTRELIAAATVDAVTGNRPFALSLLYDRYLSADDPAQANAVAAAIQSIFDIDVRKPIAPPAMKATPPPPARDAGVPDAPTKMDPEDASRPQASSLADILSAGSTRPPVGASSRPPDLVKIISETSPPAGRFLEDASVWEVLSKSLGAPGRAE